MKAGIEDWQWTQQRLEAALLVAQDERPDARIAQDLGISRTTLSRWKAHPTFQARVTIHIKNLAQVANRHGIARVDKRLKRLDKTWKRLQDVLDLRAGRIQQMIQEKDGKDEDGFDIPAEAASGLFVRKVRSVGQGEHYRLVVDWELDVATLRQLLALERQAAMETGDWQRARDGKAALAEAAMPMTLPPGNPMGSKLDALRAFIARLQDNYAVAETAQAAAEAVAKETAGQFSGCEGGGDPLAREHEGESRMA